MEHITEFFRMAGEWLDGKGFVLTSSVVLSALFGWFAWYLHRYFLPRVTSKLLSWVVQVVSQMFGVPQEQVSEEVYELPIVAQMKDWNERMIMESELKLIELQNRLVSPILSNSERIAYQAEFDYILERFGHLISEKTKGILKSVSDAADSFEVR